MTAAQRVSQAPIPQVSKSPIDQLSSVILFDGVCNLCNGFVTFVIARDPDRRFQFGALQSPAARRLLDSVDLGEAGPDSVVLVITTNKTTTPNESSLCMFGSSSLV